MSPRPSLLEADAPSLVQEHFGAGTTLQEIADRYGMSVSAVHGFLQKAAKQELDRLELQLRAGPLELDVPLDSGHFSAAVGHVGWAAQELTDRGLNLQIEAHEGMTCVTFKMEAT